MTFDDFQNKILSLLRKIPSPKDRSKKLFKVVSVDQKPFKNLPDSFEEFKAQFINDSKQVVNKEKLQRRIVGLISYLGDKEKLMPTITQEHVVEVEMSDYQIPIYAQVRQAEIKQEAKQAEKEKQKKENKRLPKREGIDELYTETKNTYRIFSRAFCNYVFPEGMIRPLPKKDLDEVLEQTNGTKQFDEEILDPILENVQSLNLEGKFDDAAEDEVITEGETGLYNQKILDALAELERNKDTHFSREVLAHCSPKFLACLDNIQNPEYSGSHLLYSHFRTLEGIGIFKFVLEANGFVELKLRKTNIKPSNIESMNLEEFGLSEENVVGESKYVIDVPKEKWNAPKFALYTGTETVEEKEMIRNIFNSDWDTLPEPLLSQVRQMGMNNFNGDVCKVLMITASGAEGINLKNVRFVHYLNHTGIQFVLNKSLVAPDVFVVIKTFHLNSKILGTFLYVSKLSEQQKADRKYKELLSKDGGFTSDEKLLQTMQQKLAVNKSLLDLMKETSIDCTVNQKDKGSTCFRLPRSDKSTYITKPDFYERSGETKVKEKKVYPTIQIKGKKYIQYEDDLVIEYEPYQKDKTVVVFGKKIMKDGKIHIQKVKKK